MQPNSPYGAAISGQGIPVSTAADSQKVLDTRWVTLDILEEPTYSNTINATTNASGFYSAYIPIFLHNLGRSPAYEAVVESFTYSANVEAQFSNLNIYADYQYIYLVPSILNFSGLQEAISITVSISIRVYTLPIEKGYTAPNENVVPRITTLPSGFGAQFLNDNVGEIAISTATPQQLAFSTTLRPLNILQYGIVTSTNGQPVINYNYGGEYPLFDATNYYPPGSISLAGALNPNTLIAPFGKDVPRGTVTPTQITIGGIQSSYGPNIAYILFKDPLGSGL